MTSQTLLVTRDRRRRHTQSALRADRHNDCVLDVLRLHKTKDFGSEILVSVRPTQSAAGDTAFSKVDALNPYRLCPYLKERMWLRTPGTLPGDNFKDK
jgi:hypothetical protein